MPVGDGERFDPLQGEIVSRPRIGVADTAALQFQKADDELKAVFGAVLKFLERSLLLSQRLFELLGMIVHVRSVSCCQRRIS